MSNLTGVFHIIPGALSVTLQGFTGDFSIDWGDGTVDSSLTHTYSDAGDYSFAIDGVTEVGTQAFFGNTAILYVAMDDAVTSIGEAAFYGCTSLVDVKLPDGLTSLSGYAFAHCSLLVEVKIPVGITTIGDQTFRECTSLRRVVLHDNITSIGTAAFYKDTQLKDVVLPEKLTTIGNQAFRETAIESISIPDGVTVLPESAFLGCKLKDVNLNKVTTLGSAVFYGNEDLQEIYIPDTVTRYDWGEFQNCYALENVHLSAKAVTIAENMFYGCGAIKKIDIPAGVVTIGPDAFNNCYDLNEVNLPNTLTTISSDVFHNCTSLKLITIPESVTSIGNGAFNYDSNLKSIYMAAKNPPVIAAATFANISAEAKYYCYSDAVESYKAATNWNTLASKIVAGDLTIDFAQNAMFTREYIGKSLSESAISEEEKIALAINAKKDKYAIQKVQDYLYYIDYDNLDYAAATKYIAEHYFTQPECSSMRKGNFFGRNLDWLYDDRPVFVVNRKATGGKFASIGLAGMVLDKATADADKYAEMIDYLPFFTLDGINENGVVCNVNIIPANLKQERASERDTTGTNPGKTDVPMICLVRRILDEAKSAEDAIYKIQNEYNIMRVEQGEFAYKEAHYMIADKDHTYVVEFINNEAVITESFVDEKPIMTNFYLDGFDGTIESLVDSAQTYAQGVERYMILAQKYDGVKDADSMMRAMREVNFTHAYTNEDDIWYSEFTGGNLTITSPSEDFANILSQARAAYARRSRFNPVTWQTVHTSVYDVENKTLKLSVQEEEKVYNFALETPGTYRAVSTGGGLPEGGNNGDVLTRKNTFTGAPFVIGGVVNRIYINPNFTGYKDLAWDYDYFNIFDTYAEGQEDNSNNYACLEVWNIDLYGLDLLSLYVFGNEGSMSFEYIINTTNAIISTEEGWAITPGMHEINEEDYSIDANPITEVFSIDFDSPKPTTYGQDGDCSGFASANTEFEVEDTAVWEAPASGLPEGGNNGDVLVYTAGPGVPPAVDMTLSKIYFNCDNKTDLLQVESSEAYSINFENGSYNFNISAMNADDGTVVPGVSVWGGGNEKTIVFNPSDHVVIITISVDDQIFMTLNPGYNLVNNEDVPTTEPISGIQEYTFSYPVSITNIEGDFSKFTGFLSFNSPFSSGGAEWKKIEIDTSNKLDKVNNAEAQPQVYATAENEQIMLPIDTDANPDTLAMRDENGNVKTDYPVSNEDAVPKSYLEEQLETVTEQLSEKMDRPTAIANHFPIFKEDGNITDSGYGELPAVEIPVVNTINTTSPSFETVPTEAAIVELYNKLAQAIIALGGVIDPGE